MTKAREVTNLRLDPAIKRTLARLAKADERTLSELIRKIIGDWLQAQKETK